MHSKVMGQTAPLHCLMPEGALVHVLGMPRINLALVDWRRDEAAREGGNKDVLNWTLPYEIMVVGYYGVLDEDAEDGERIMFNCGD